MIQYYSPNFNFLDLIKVSLIINGNRKVIEYFKALTGKKYILLTHSCRSALYLSYKSINDRDTVLTSLLSCRAALDPIIKSGKKILYSKINPLDFNIESFDYSIENQIVQINYQSGLLLRDINSIISNFKSKGNLIIEDCAQSFLSKSGGKYCGILGDVSCFSLVKNAYGIGGGVLATNNESIYNNAKNIQDEFDNVSISLVFFRLVKAIIETKRIYKLGDRLYNFLLEKRFNNRAISSFEKHLNKPSSIFFKVFVVQSRKFNYLHKKRRELSVSLLEMLHDEGVINYDVKEFDNYLTASYTKLFIYNPKWKTKDIILYLNKKGIEAKHLEHTFVSNVQINLLNDETYRSDIGHPDAKLYEKLHTSIISLPLHEKLKENDLRLIVDTLKSYSDE